MLGGGVWNCSSITCSSSFQSRTQTHTPNSLSKRLTMRLPRPLPKILKSQFFSGNAHTYRKNIIYIHQGICSHMHAQKLHPVLAEAASENSQFQLATQVCISLRALMLEQTTCWECWSRQHAAAWIRQYTATQIYNHHSAEVEKDINGLYTSC